MPDGHLRANEQKLANLVEQAARSSLESLAEGIQLKTELREAESTSYRAIHVQIHCQATSLLESLEACKRSWNVIRQVDHVASRKLTLTCSIPDNLSNESSVPDDYPQTFTIELIESPEAGNPPVPKDDVPGKVDEHDGITLLLSGGGFRATLFHLGVIRYLRETNRLKDVREIFSVSGGSILAGHLALNWDDYTGSEPQFDKAATNLVNFTRNGTREFVLQYYLLFFVMAATMVAGWLSFMSFGFESSGWHIAIAVTSLIVAIVVLIVLERFLRPVSTLQRRYASLFDNKKQADITKDVDYYFLTTNLTTGNIACFTKDRIYWDVQGEPSSGNNVSFVPTDVCSLAGCVSASSAFPPLFSPWLFIPNRYSIDKNVLSDTQYFTDGGVFDNLGLRACKWLSSNTANLLVSDAERQFDWSTDETFRYIVSRATRATDVLMNRVNQLEFELLEVSEDVFDLSQFDSVKFVRLKKDFPAASLSESLQRRIRKIRTDLDSFSDIEIQGLFSAGMLAAKAADGQPPTWDEGVTFESNGLPTGYNSPRWLPIPELAKQRAKDATDLLETSERPNLFWKTISRGSFSLVMIILFGLIFAAINPLTLRCLQLYPQTVASFSADTLTPVADEDRSFMSFLSPMLAQMSSSAPQDGRATNYYIVESRDLGSYTRPFNPRPFDFSLSLEGESEIFSQSAFVLDQQTGAIKNLSGLSGKYAVSKPSREGRLIVLAGIARKRNQPEPVADQFQFKTESIP